MVQFLLLLVTASSTIIFVPQRKDIFVFSIFSAITKRRKPLIKSINIDTRIK